LELKFGLLGAGKQGDMRGFSCYFYSTRTRESLG
jgi:hypothetical protein